MNDYFSLFRQVFPYAFKVNSHGILHYLCSEDLSKSFSQLTVSIFIFSQYFFPKIFPGGKSSSHLSVNIFFQKFLLGRKGSSQYLYFLSTFFSRFCQVEKCGLPYIAYIVIHYFLISNCIFRDNGAD